MIDLVVNKVSRNEDDILLSRRVNLGPDLEALIFLSSHDHAFADLFLGKMLDSLMDMINQNNIYDDFSVALENINSFLDTWNRNQEHIDVGNAIVALVHKKELFFSVLGTPSVYLIDEKKELIEVHDPENYSKNFGFISSGALTAKEIMVFATIDLKKYLSESDIIEGVDSGELSGVTDNIESILKAEKSDNDVIIAALQYAGIQEEDTKESVISRGGDIVMSLLDNSFTKAVLAKTMQLKERFNLGGKKGKNLLFSIGIFISFIALYMFLNSFLSVIDGEDVKQEARQTIIQIESLLSEASNQKENADVFNEKINESEKLIADLKAQNLASGDIARLEEDIDILNKQFNGIESFRGDQNNLVFKLPEGITPVGITVFADKTYIAGTDRIIGPIITGKEPQTYVFDGLKDGDEFTDIDSTPTSILLKTKNGLIVRFNTRNEFAYANVKGQPVWEESKTLNTFLENIYLVNSETNQILKHAREGADFKAGEPYLTPEDAQSIGKIETIAIDGGIYILKSSDLSMLKLFNSPKYRLEPLTLNSLPKNYERGVDDTSIELIASKELKYVYMLLGQRIFVFEPNSQNYKDVKSLKYLGQIEGSNMKIKSIFVPSSSEILALGEGGLYTIEFDVIEGALSNVR